MGTDLIISKFPGSKNIPAIFPRSVTALFPSTSLQDDAWDNPLEARPLFAVHEVRPNPPVSRDKNLSSRQTVTRK